MKRTMLLFVSVLYLGSISAQTINFETATPAPAFQDADVGAMAFGDIDNDGDDDLMVTGKGGPVLSTLYNSDGNGNFTEVVGTPFINVFGGSVGFEDFDGDGFLDLLITGNTHGGTPTAHLYMNNGNGNFTLSTGTPFESSNAGGFAFADVDADGDKDVIITGLNTSDQGFTTLYLNDGTGVFTEALETPFEQVKFSSVEFIDIDNDDDQDIILAGSKNDDTFSTSLYINDGTGKFSLDTNVSFENISSGDIAITDSDNDGDLDILLVGGAVNNGYIANLYKNDGAGGFSLVPETPFSGTIVGASEFADFDDDGDDDLLIIGAGASGVIAEIFENQGSNNFVLADQIGEAYLSSIAIGDMDGDDDLDVIIGGTSFTSPFRATKTYRNESLTALPVELNSFTARLNSKEEVILEWITENEIDNKGFEIERSTNSRDWQKIEFVEGQGNTSELNKYQSEDLAPFIGDNYYRLKQIDFDGQFEYSNIVSVRLFTLKKKFQITPNPTSGPISIQTETPFVKDTSFRVFNAQGKIVLFSSLVDRQDNLELDLSILPTGIYYLQVLNHENYITMKIAKQ